MDEIINGIDLSKYFINHYNSSNKLYAVEYNGNPLELQNAIKRLQEENKELKEKIKSANCPYYDNGDCSCMGEVKEIYKYKQSFEEIREIINSVKNEYMNIKNKELALYHTELNGALSVVESIEDTINEVLK